MGRFINKGIFWLFGHLLLKPKQKHKEIDASNPPNLVLFAT